VRPKTNKVRLSERTPVSAKSSGFNPAVTAGIALADKRYDASELIIDSDEKLILARIIRAGNRQWQR
jgi:hypothetical protein